MRDRKKRNIIIGSLCCLLVFMAVGYALLSQTLNINGIANLTGKWKIYIDSITVKEVGGSAKSNTAEVTEDKLTANFDVELLKPGDYVEYDVVVKNEGTINAVLRELIPNIESNNMDILLTHSIIQGQILKAESETKFTLKIRFDERATEIVSGGKTSFDIQMVYEQYDGDAESIDPSLVPVTANDCFTISDTGVITNYDYSCGTYITIPAVVNGTTVTEISSTAFAKGDFELYMNEDGYPVFYVAQTKELYDTLYAMFVEEGAPEELIATALFMKGDTLPDTTGMTIEKYNFVNGETVEAYSSIEYLDLSQARGLTKIAEGAFLSNGDAQTLKYLNIEGINSKVVEGAALFDYSNLESLTIDTDLYSEVKKANMIATIDTLRIYPGSSTEIPDQDVYLDYEITVNNLIIGEGITRIGNYSFRGNYNEGAWDVKNVKLPESLIEIGDYAFAYNPITKLDLPSNLKTIGKGAFHWTDLTNLTFEGNSKLTYIGNDAFSSTELTEVDFSPIKQKFEISTDAFYSTNIENVVIDDVILHSGALVGIDSLELIGDIEFKLDQKSYVVSVAGGLDTLIIKSDTLEEIPDKAFGFDNTTPTTLEFLNKSGTAINSSIKTIGNLAFSSAVPTTLILPTSLEIICVNAFESANPTTFVMSPVIKTIYANAFKSLTIESLTIPSTIEGIGTAAFGSMPSTSTITVNKAEGSFTEVDGWNGDATVIYNP